MSGSSGSIGMTRPGARTRGSRWIDVLSERSQARMRLICFPYAGGSSAVFRPWVPLFPPQIELCAVQLPGRGSRLRDAPIATLPELVDQLVPALTPWLDRPWAAFGHSMGSLIAQATVRRLPADAHARMGHLFVSARRPPHLPPTDKNYGSLSDAEFKEELRHLSGTPPELLKDHELMELIMPALRADFRICHESWGAAETPLACPITAFGGADDLEVTPAHIQAWSKETTGPFQAHILETGHFLIHSAADRVVRLITAELDRILARSAA